MSTQLPIFTPIMADNIWMLPKNENTSGETEEEMLTRLENKHYEQLAAIRNKKQATSGLTQTTDTHTNVQSDDLHFEAIDDDDDEIQDIADELDFA